MRNDSSRFEGLLEKFFETTLDDFPMLATSAGLRSGEGKLGLAAPDFVKRQHGKRLKTLRALGQIPPSELSAEQHLDRLALRSQLLREIEDFERGRHTLDPNGVEQVLNSCLHELIRGEDEPARGAANLRSLLAETPRFLTESASLVQRPEAVWRKVMQQTVQGAPTLFDSIRTFLAKTQPRSDDASRIESAQKACERYRDKVSNLPLAPAGQFAIGAAMLQRRVRDQLGLDYSLAEIEALAEAEAIRLGGLLAAACAKFGRNKTPQDVLEAARAEWNPGGDLVEVYRAETRRLQNAFNAAKAVTFPADESLVVRPVPEFMRSLFPTAAYSSPGAFEKRQRGSFWVNDLSVLQKTEAGKRKERAQHFGLVLTCAHEGYPGHHLQFVTANRHPRRWRRLFAHAVFYEGWTLWCEQMVVLLKIERAPWLRVQQLHDALWRCHRILVDLRLQTGRYSYEQAVRHMCRHLDFTQARAEGDVNWYTGSPSVPMSYWLGRLENARLYQRLVEGRGWSLKKFNDWLLSFGTLPQAWIEKYGLD